MTWLIDFLSGLATEVVKFFEGFFQNNPGFMDFLKTVVKGYFEDFLAKKGYKDVNKIVEVVEQTYDFVKNTRNIEDNASAISDKIKLLTGLDVTTAQIIDLKNFDSSSEAKYRLAYDLAEYCLRNLGMDVTNKDFKRVLNLSIEMAVNAMVNTGVKNKLELGD